jgi:hypothetical protein
MAEFPWQSHSRAAPERDYVALLSYLPLNSGWSIPRLLLYNARIRRQLRTSAGLVGYSLWARLARRRRAVFCESSVSTRTAWDRVALMTGADAVPPILRQSRTDIHNLGQQTDSA